MSPPPDPDDPAVVAAELVARLRNACRGVDPLTVPCRECHSVPREACHVQTRPYDHGGGVVTTIRRGRPPHDTRVWDARFAAMAADLAPDLAAAGTSRLERPAMHAVQFTGRDLAAVADALTQLIDEHHRRPFLSFTFAIGPDGRFRVRLDDLGAEWSPASGQPVQVEPASTAPAPSDAATVYTQTEGRTS